MNTSNTFSRFKSSVERNKLRSVAVGATLLGGATLAALGMTAQTLFDGRRRRGDR